MACGGAGRATGNLPPMLLTIAVWALLGALNAQPIDHTHIQEAKQARWCDTHLAENDYGAAVEQWCPIVRLYFGEWSHWALHVMRCESNGNPYARNGTHHGLYQQKAIYWPGRSSRAGWAGADVNNPEANVAVSAWLLDQRRSRTSHWTCTARHAYP